MIFDVKISKDKVTQKFKEICEKKKKGGKKNDI